MRQFGRKYQCQEAQPIQTGREGSPPSNMTQTAVPIGGVAVDLIVAARFRPTGAEGLRRDVYLQPAFHQRVGASRRL